MAEGGIALRLVNFANIFVGFIRGGLAMVNILASMFFGGISGSSVADTSSIGSIMIPMMKRQGYDDAFSVNVTITSSTQGIVIPPSHNAVIYSYAAGGTVSIASLFLAGIVPGIMIGLALMALAAILATARNYPKGERVPLREALKASGEAVLGLITVIIIVGGVIGGVFTATESAAIAVIYAFVITMFVYREIGWRDLPKLIHNVAKTVAMVMILIGFASGFAYMMALMQLPAKVTAAILTISQNKYVVLALINLTLLVPRHDHGHGAPDPDLHADLLAGDQGDRRRPGAFRHHHAAQSRHRPGDAAGRLDPVRRLRDRQGPDRGGLAQAVAVLAHHADRAAAGDLPPAARHDHPELGALLGEDEVVAAQRISRTSTGSPRSAHARSAVSTG